MGERRGFLERQRWDAGIGLALLLAIQHEGLGKPLSGTGNRLSPDSDRFHLCGTSALVKEDRSLAILCRPDIGDVLAVKQALAVFLRRLLGLLPDRQFGLVLRRQIRIRPRR